MQAVCVGMLISVFCKRRNRILCNCVPVSALVDELAWHRPGGLAG